MVSGFHTTTTTSTSHHFTLRGIASALRSRIPRTTKSAIAAPERPNDTTGHICQSPHTITTMASEPTPIPVVTVELARQTNSISNCSDPRTKDQILASQCAICIAASRCQRCIKSEKGATNLDDVTPDILHQIPPTPADLPAQHPDFAPCMPPTTPTYRKFSVFLAGSIEMGRAVQWQPELTARLRHLPITVCNPRRGAWDDSITPSASDAGFHSQVTWELSALENADVVCFFFDECTLSPVSLLELGLHARGGRAVVCCGDRYWKSGNVHITCKRYGVPLVKRFDELPELVEGLLKQKGMVLDEAGDLVGENVKEHVKVYEGD